MNQSSRTISQKISDCEQPPGDINLLLTEHEGRTGQYWPEVVAERTERPYKHDRGPIFPSTARTS